MSIWLRGWGGLRRIRSKHCIASLVSRFSGFTGTWAPEHARYELTYLERFGVPLQLLVYDAKPEVDLVYLLKVCCSESGDMTP